MAIASGKKIEVVSYGEPLIGIYPPKDCSIGDDQPLSKTWGGDTSNFALALSRLGHGVAYLTRISTDDLGQSFLRLWQRGGVDISLVQRDEHRSLGLYFVSFEAEKHNFIYYRKNSAASCIDAGKINWELVKQARVLHLSGISQAISQNALEVSFQLMEYAKKNGLLVSYDINFRSLLWKRELALAVILHTIGEYVDILEMTDEELTLLGGEEKLDGFLDHFPRVPELVALKMGERGGLLRRGGEVKRFKAFAVEVADTVGAGDAFDAGLIAGILENMELEELGVFANAVAASTCRGIGPLRRQPTRDEVLELIRQHSRD